MTCIKKIKTLSRKNPEAVYHIWDKNGKQDYYLKKGKMVKVKSANCDYDLVHGSSVRPKKDGYFKILSIRPKGGDRFEEYTKD